VIPIANNAGRDTGGENALTTLSAGTGGRVFTPGSASDLDRVFADILRDLRTQYMIGYYPKDVPSTKDRFHTLKVSVNGQNLRVTTRSGYYGESDAPRGFGR
jgi:Ca-activated chloride channel family protein